MFNPSNMHERLAAGESIPLPNGKRARPTGPATTCPKCKGSGRVVEESSSPLYGFDEYPCGHCQDGTIVPFVIELDPMVLAPWIGTMRSGLAERFTVTNERVAFIENDKGEVSVGIDPPDGKRVTIDLRACKGTRQRRSEALDLTWAIAIRLADAELRALGYRGT